MGVAQSTEDFSGANTPIAIGSPDPGNTDRRRMTDQLDLAIAHSPVSAKRVEDPNPPFRATPLPHSALPKLPTWAEYSSRAKTGKITRDAVYGWLADRDRFEAAWKWYSGLAKTYGFKAGEKVEAAYWYLVEIERKEEVERFEQAMPLYEAQKRQEARQKPKVFAPHLCRYIAGSEQHLTPYWVEALQSAQPAPETPSASSATLSDLQPRSTESVKFTPVYRAEGHAEAFALRQAEMQKRIARLAALQNPA